MLGVMQLHPVTDGLAQLRGDRFVANAKVPQLRRNAGAHVLSAAVVERDLAFLSLAYPAAPHEFLQHARAFAFGIGPCQGQPSPQPRADHNQQQQYREPATETTAGTAPSRGIGNFNPRHEVKTPPRPVALSKIGGPGESNN